MLDILTKGSPGLLTDARIVSSVLERSGIENRIFVARRRNFDLEGLRAAKRAARLLGGAGDAANIFLERIRPGWIPLARRNFLVPNQEWCDPETVAHLGRMDLILCKTRHAEEIFKHRGFRTAYVGFSSEDRFRPAVAKSFLKFLHVAGRSEQKGTRVLIDVWSRHPDWPTLIVVGTAASLKAIPQSANIRLSTKPLPLEELVALQNECGVHLCPSESEGYGHYIGEALGCGAVVVTTDAPPMNELVAPERGLLAAYKNSRPQDLGTCYSVDAEALERAIVRTLALDDGGRRALSRAARSWFLTNQAEFERRFGEVVTRALR